MRQTWPIRLFQALGYVLVALFLLDWYVLMFSPSWITLPDTFIIYLAVILSGYSLVRQKVIPDTDRPKPPPLVRAIALIILAGMLLSGLYRLWPLG